MSKVSFERTIDVVATPVADVTVESVTTVSPATPVAITPVVSSPVPESSVPARINSPIEFDDQNIGFEDIILPRINLVHKVGGLSEIFNSGEIVLKQTLVIYSPGRKHPDPALVIPADAPLNLVILGFKKVQFAEKVVGGAQGILVNTEQEIIKNGGTLDYKEWEASVAAAARGEGKALRMFQRLATALLLVERPAKIADTDHIEFPYECEGKYYALALWAMKGTAYTHAAKTMFTDRKIGHLRTIRDASGNVLAGGYSTYGYSLSTSVKTFGENPTVIPVVKPAGKTSEGFRAFARVVIGLD